MDNYLNKVMFIRKNKRENAQAQIEFNNKKNFAATYLTIYDVFADSDYVDYLKKATKPIDEIGAWLEVTKELVEKVGIVWRGKFGLGWVHTTNVGMLPGYTNEEKEKLIDEMMNAFKSSFGYYPKTIGAWVIDVYSLNYIADKYGVDATILCREQWGMDAISPWGGPYYGAYYPCKNNIMCPAQTEEEQINVPVFKMYVNDPIYCYYEHKDKEFNGVPGGPVTQEPAFDNSFGHNPKWLKWIWECLFGDKSIGFSYFQLGQENGFDWDIVEKGLSIQYDLLENGITDKYKLEYITVGEMGRRFKEKYKKTPERLVAALEDWQEIGNQSLWFYNSDYRINLFADKDNVWIRDIHIFDENYTERYLKEPCETHGVLYDNLPVTDGVRFASPNLEKPGFYFGKGRIEGYEKNGDEYIVKIKTEDNLINVKLCDKKIEMIAQKDFELDFKCDSSWYHSCDYVHKVEEKEIKYVARRKMYSVIIEDGRIDNMTIKSENGKVTFVLKK